MNERAVMLVLQSTKNFDTGPVPSMQQSSKVRAEMYISCTMPIAFHSAVNWLQFTLYSISSHQYKAKQNTHH
jgi:hypothetical protein